jgi:L,D-transpeptidase YcbB
MKPRVLMYLIPFLIFIGCNTNEEIVEPTISENPREINKKDPYQKAIPHVAQEIQTIIENKEPEERYEVMGEKLYSSVLLPDLYIEREFEPLWLKHSDSLHLAYEMISFIESSKFHGFQPQHYHLTLIQSLKSEIEENGIQPNQIAAIDLLLTDAFLILSSHLYHGKVNPERLTTEWGIQRNKPELQLGKKLLLLLKSESVFEFMENFYPPHPGYKKMVTHAKHLDSIKQSDFKLSISLNRNQRFIDLEEDSTYNEALFKKLHFIGLADTNSTESILKGIRIIQRQYGLNEDGKIGRNTLAALNHLYEDQQKSLFVNMERLRWLPDSLNQKHILVNIADFSLHYLVDRDTLISMKTVVGQQFRQTPVFNAKMTYLVFSPTWTVPPGILRNDVIPAAAKNINYLSQKKMTILDGSGKAVDPSSIDWKKVRAGGSFPYRVRQSPGAHNALGRVKFMFPNKYSVYLHDTPSKELFDRDERIFSSGCIRIEKPFELTKLLLEDNEKWNEETIKDAMFSEREQTVRLKSAVDVYIYYLTAWASETEVFFRQDVYNRDMEVYTALQQKRY